MSNEPTTATTDRVLFALLEGRVLDWESGRETLRLTLLECEALHLLTVLTTETLVDDFLLKVRDVSVVPDSWISK